MRNYELMMVVVPHLDDESFAATLEKVNVYIGDRGGSVVGQQRWGSIRRLAYPIRSYNEGSYVVTHFEIEPEHTNGLDTSLTVSEDILRHIIVKVDKFGELPGTQSRTAGYDSEPNREEVQNEPQQDRIDSAQTDTVEDSIPDSSTDSQEQNPEDESTNELIVEEPETESSEDGEDLADEGKEEKETEQRDQA